MFDTFRKSIVYQRSIIRALFNNNAIDLKEFEDINNGLNLLQAELDEKEKKTWKYKWAKFRKKKCTT